MQIRPTMGLWFAVNAPAPSTVTMPMQQPVKVVWIMFVGIRLVAMASVGRIIRVWHVLAMIIVHPTRLVIKIAVILAAMLRHHVQTVKAVWI
jgi:hypothetical protein